MSGSVEIVLWLHEYEHKALERQLALDGSNIEKTMQEMLMEQYSQRVPFEEQKAIRDRIDAEHAEQAAEQLANTTWAAYHITGQGEDSYFKTAAADTLLIAAKRLRTYLTKNDTPQSGSFAAVFKIAWRSPRRSMISSWANAWRTLVRCPVSSKWILIRKSFLLSAPWMGGILSACTM